VESMEFVWSRGLHVDFIGSPCGVHMDSLNLGVPLEEIPCGVHMES
jgi:hypothetical protein